MEYSNRKRWAYIVIGFFLGGIGIHNFYAKRTASAVLQLLLGITIFGLIINIPWNILEMIFVKYDGDGKRFS